MNLDWQNITALLLVVAAGIYAVRWVCRSMCEGSGCGDCPTNSDAQPTTKQIVSIDELVQTSERRNVR